MIEKITPRMNIQGATFRALPCADPIYSTYYTLFAGIQTYTGCVQMGIGAMRSGDRVILSPVTILSPNELWMDEEYAIPLADPVHISINLIPEKLKVEYEFSNPKFSDTKIIRHMYDPPRLPVWRLGWRTANTTVTWHKLPH